MRFTLQPVIWKAMKGKGWMRNMEISELIQKRRSSVHNALADLMDKGCVEKKGNGPTALYRATKRNPECGWGTNPNSLNNLRNVMTGKVRTGRGRPTEVFGKRCKFATELERCWRVPQFAHLERGA